MHKNTIQGIPLWQFDQFAKIKNIQHYISGREGGVSQGEKSSLNLSYLVGDNPTHVATNRENISQAMQVPIDHLVFPQQTHSNNVKVIDRNNNEALEQIDGLITATPGICINVLAADCAPILLLDKKKQVIGAVHAGWRGTVGLILTKAIEAMKENFGSNVTDIMVGIGPAIGPKVYEVGEEVIEAVHSIFPDNASKLLQPLEEKGKALFNLWEANKQQLMNLGILEENIEVAEICTFTNSNQFFSARASRNGGRFGAGIKLDF